MFKFRFQTLLRYRKRIEERRERGFMTIKKRELEEREVLNRLNMEKAKLEGMFSLEKDKKDVDIYLLNLYENYMDALEEGILKQKDILEKVENESEKKRTALLSALKDRKIIERLKEREEANYLAWINKREQRLVDDISVIRYKRDFIY